MNADAEQAGDVRRGIAADYHALFSRVVATPGLDIAEEFNSRPSRENSLNQRMADAGYTSEQRQDFIAALSRANRAGQAIQEGRLQDAEFYRGLAAQSLQSIGETGLVPPERLRSMSADVDNMSTRIEEARPGRYADAQRFLADTLRQGGQGEEAARAASMKFYETLLDAGLSPEQASTGFHAMQDALVAKRIIQTMTSGEPAQKALDELSESVRRAAEARPPVMDAANLETLRSLEKTLAEKHVTPAQSLLGEGRILGTRDVVGDFTLDPAQAREVADDRAAKLQALIAWRDGKSGVHSLGGFYDYVFRNAPDALETLQKAQKADASPENDVKLVKAVQRAEELLGTISPEFRTQTPEQLAKRVDDLRESSFRQADQLADLVGVIPVVGSRAKFLIKETAIGLRYASGDISGTEAVASTVKEAASAVVGDAIFKEKVLDKFAKTGADLLAPLAVAIGGNVSIEVARVVGQNAWSDISAEKLTQAVAVGISKGIVEGGFKVAEKLKLGDDRLDEFAKVLVKIAQKFGLERPVDQMIDRELKSRSPNGKPYALEGETPGLPASSNAAATPADRRTDANDRRIVAAVERLEGPNAPANDGERRNVATALAEAATRSGLTDVDTVVPSKDGTRLIAIQGDPNSDTRRIAHVELAEARQQPADQTLARMDVPRDAPVPVPAPEAIAQAEQAQSGRRV